MAHKKGGGSSRNGRDSNAQRLGVKRFGGQLVKAGDVILVLEAMKMENDIVAPCDGTVASVAAKGTSVNTDDVLATLS